jgi:hypothetical protein
MNKKNFCFQTSTVSFAGSSPYPLHTFFRFFFKSRLPVSKPTSLTKKKFLIDPTYICNIYARNCNICLIYAHYIDQAKKHILYTATLFFFYFFFLNWVLSSLSTYTLHWYYFSLFINKKNKYYLLFFDPLLCKGPFVRCVCVCVCVCNNYYDNIIKVLYLFMFFKWEYVKTKEKERVIERRKIILCNFISTHLCIFIYVIILSSSYP